MANLINNIAEALSVPAGEVFFASLVKNLAALLDVDGALVGTLRNDGVPAVKVAACVFDGAVISNFEYSLPASDGPGSFSQKLHCEVPVGLKDYLPNCGHAASYLEEPLCDARGRTLGLLAVINRKPLEHPTVTRSVLQIFAARAAAELERVGAQECLRASEERLLSVLNHAPVIVWAMDHEGTVTFSAGKGLAALKFHSGQLVGQSVFKLYQEFPKILEYNRRVLAGEEFTTTSEFGNVILETRWTPLFDARRNVTGATGVCTDITARMKAEESLRASEERLKAQYKNLPIPTYLWQHAGDDFVLIDYNNASEAITHGGIARWVGRKASKVYSERPDVLMEMQQCLKQEQVIRRETLYKLGTTGESKYLDLCYVFVPPDLVMIHAEDVSERKQSENALRSSEQNLRALFDNALDAILLADDAGRYVDANPAACDLLGYSRNELLQMSLSNITPQPEQPAGLDSWQYFLSIGQMSGEYSLLRKDNRTREVEFRAVANILPGLHLTILRDVTQRKHNEETLRRSQLQLAEAQQLAHLGSWEWDVAADRVYGSDELLRIFGTTQEEFGGSLQWVLERIHEDDRNAVRIACEQSIRFGQSFDSLYRFIRPDGSIRIIRSHGVIAQTKNGNPTRLFGTAHDVTEQQQFETALRQSESRLRRLTEANIIGIIISDVQGRIIEANPTLLHLIGYSADDLARGEVRWDTMTPLTSRHRMRRAIGQLQKSGAAVPWEQEFICKTGDIVPVLMGATLLEDSQDRFIAFVVDLRAQKSAEASLRQMTAELLDSHQHLRALAARLESIREDASTRIAREIHDELGQAMTGLKMDLSWLARQLSHQNSHHNKAESSEIVQKIDAMLQLLDATIQSVRRICGELRPRILDDLGLEAAVEWQLQEFQKRSGTRCTLESHIAHLDLGREISTAVFRILQESLTNSARHAGASRVKVMLKAKAGNLILQVKDNGRGFNADGTVGTNTLGLLGMHERALFLGGQVSIKSAAGKGTMVMLCIPLVTQIT